MKKLPNEILVSIVDHLTFTAKLELARACKKWYEVLLQSNLYKVLTFMKLDNLYQAVEMFNKKQHIKQTVHDLGCYSVGCDNMALAGLLPLSFPKVTSFKWEDCIARKLSTPAHLLCYAATLQQWRDIEYLVYRTQHLDIGTSLLRSTHCNKLTHLETHFIAHYIVAGQRDLLLQELISISIMHHHLNMYILNLQQSDLYIWRTCITAYQTWKVSFWT